MFEMFSLNSAEQGQLKRPQEGTGELRKPNVFGCSDLVQFGAI
jgi:hypothetical protein